ncbi:hypothetical protein [Streptomyces sp. NPDC018584]|uniref:hypothetical protein n=1 Tax=unclassified Streptomyces TaxID=2593676 RepID=UPI0037BD42A8
MIQHMSMIFKADGLSVGEGAFLMACTNHTDAKGYVIAHMQQVADEAHMSLRTAQATRAKLEKRGLLKAAPRFSPKNRAQLANLFRINLDRLRSMERKRKDYGATLIEELTFDEAPDDASKENRSSDPHADFAPPPARSAPPPCEICTPPCRFRIPPCRFRGGRGCEICTPSLSLFFSLFFSLFSLCRHSCL